MPAAASVQATISEQVENLNMQEGNSASARGLLGESAHRAVALVLLLSVGAIWESGRLHSLANPEIWGHLKLGSWILQNRSWPEFGLFSQTGKTPWRDLNWGYDLLAGLAYRLVGLRAVPALLMCFRVALAGVTFFLAGGWRNFWSAATLSAVAQYVLAGTGPDAVCVSVIFFGIELFVLLDAQSTGNLRRLYFLPVLFFFWANLDIGFLYGIALYVFFCARWRSNSWAGQGTGAVWRNQWARFHSVPRELWELLAYCAVC